jgi:hypothetical protein
MLKVCCEVRVLGTPRHFVAHAHFTQARTNMLLTNGELEQTPNAAGNCNVVLTYGVNCTLHGEAVIHSERCRSSGGLFHRHKRPEAHSRGSGQQSKTQLRSCNWVVIGLTTVSMV